ncbi:aldehyde dehydrogenase [Streptomyces sp. DSM 110735]|uniref:aldehyde dehydrogenase family protein n=1 Tax=Streptomyces sp. DSM 110735 TaxID=2775031 RepID=UPI001F5B11E7|nr:aldehyde dehydrogenase family protein [Streptomyces sp. DSM 110735]
MSAGSKSTRIPVSIQFSTEAAHFSPGSRHRQAPGSDFEIPTHARGDRVTLTLYDELPHRPPPPRRLLATESAPRARGCCTAVLKPAEDASLSVLRIAELLTEAGVPDGVINVVTGYGKDAGSALAEHHGVDRIAFTGSVGTAQSIVRASAGNMKRLQRELGGKSPDIVFADADLDLAVPGAAMGVYTNSGQVCVTGTRIFVQRPVHDEFVARLGEFTRTVRVGNGLDPDTQIGPLISARQLERVQHYIEIGTDEARLVTGGSRLTGEHADGCYIEPTVFAGATNDMTIAQEEIFGPVATVIPFDDLDEAIRLANATPYGLAGGLWTRNVSTAHKVSRAITGGTVWVNCYGVLDPAIGFGGTKMSGYGWKGAREHVENYLYPKAVYMNLG